MSNIVIDIAAEFTGKKAFSNAEKATKRLDQAGKNLGRTITRSLGTAAILAYSKASVKAYVADDNAARSLGQTLKNLGLAYGANAVTVNGYISRLEAQTGVLDDELRPAMDRLLRATGSVEKSQKLLNLALDISAGTGKDLTQVSQSLQKAYLGQTQSLGRLGVGLSKAELTSSSFADIQDKLTVLFAGQASSAAESYAGQLNKLTVAANNAKETIGKGLVDALISIGGTGTSGGAVEGINKLAAGIADTLKNVGGLIDKLRELKPVFIAIGVAAALAFAPITTTILGLIYLAGKLNKMLDKSLFKQGIIPNGMGNISMTVSGQVDNSVLNKQKAVTKLTKEQAAAQAKILADKKLSAAIDKANLLLGKGGNLFDMDAIQLNAAMINQAEQLGKATSQSQLLMITNDIARLKIKQDIAALEDAIASKDEARITAATNQLDKDLKIYNALTNQNLKLGDIKAILDSLLPKDLINLANLTEAIRLLTIINNGKTPSITNPVAPESPLVPKTPNPLVPVVPVVPVVPKAPEGAGTKTDAQKWAEEIAAKAAADAAAAAQVSLTSQVAQSSFAMGIGAGLSTAASISGARYAAQAAAQMGGGYVVNVYANTVSNPDELSGLIQDTIIRLNKQGDYLTTAGAL